MYHLPKFAIFTAKYIKPFILPNTWVKFGLPSLTSLEKEIQFIMTL